MPLLDIHGISKLLNLPVQRVRALAREKKLPAIQFHPPRGRYLFDKKRVQEALDQLGSLSQGVSA